jgi:hypothetical protein
MRGPDDSSPYRNIEQLDACMREPQRWCLVMEADFGGVPLLVAPLHILKALPEDRLLLLRDLEAIVCGLGFRTDQDYCWESEERLEKGTVESITALPGYQRCGSVRDGVWIKRTLDDQSLIHQIIRVLSGQQKRLGLPELWPNDPPIPSQIFASLAEARVYARRAIAEIEPRGRGTCQTMIRIPVDQIKINETDLVRLSEYLARLDSLTEGEYVPGSAVRRSLITYRVQPNMRNQRLNDVWIADWIEARGMRDMILSVLRGQQSMP